MSTIDHDAPEPPYRQIADILMARIVSGELAPRRRIPSEHDLIVEFGVARDTVRRAVAYLREQGYVRTIPQRGTFVADELPPADAE